MNEYYSLMYDDDYLEHFGVKGMHWGIRRYQNKDGTLTPEGHKRLSKMSYKEAKKVAKQQSESFRNNMKNASKHKAKMSKYLGEAEGYALRSASYIKKGKLKKGYKFEDKAKKNIKKAALEVKKGRPYEKAAYENRKNVEKLVRGPLKKQKIMMYRAASTRSRTHKPIGPNHVYTHEYRNFKLKKNTDRNKKKQSKFAKRYGNNAEFYNKYNEMRTVVPIVI